MHMTLLTCCAVDTVDTVDICADDTVDTVDMLCS